MAYTAVSKPSATGPAFDLGALFRAAIDAYRIHQTRRMLRALSDRELLDIGLVRADIDKVGLSGKARG
ncbi:DUF1127 domain-containing protein [Tropicimonas sp. S265A]|uniref:DUF1127 domain-containing protein n=1 Tax=Tropicimonas sp. S265A TaxID=3415134 RepID=UPI003C7D7AFD